MHWCHAQLANFDGVCVHGEKAALLYKPVHFTACRSLHQVSDGALDANTWPGASFITNANETETCRFGFTNGATGVQEVIHSEIWRMVLLHFHRKKVLKERPFFPNVLIENVEALEAADRCQVMVLFSHIINPLFQKVRFNLEWNTEFKKKKKEINLNISPAVPLTFNGLKKNPLMLLISFNGLMWRHWMAACNHIFFRNFLDFLLSFTISSPAPPSSPAQSYW